MLTEERFAKILSILERMGSVTVQQLMTELDASESTVRRVGFSSPYLPCGRFATFFIGLIFIILILSPFLTVNFTFDFFDAFL